MPALLSLVRALIDYGKEFAATLHQRTAENPYFAVLNYATNDLALVMARVTRGLLRAAALEERLLRACGRAGPDHRARPTTQPTTKPAPQRSPRARPVAVPTPNDDNLLTQPPTPEEIAAEVRRRPIGAVILDICRDLAIRPDHPLWRDIQDTVVKHGGSYIRLMKHVITRHIRLAAELVVASEPSSPVLLSPPSAGTGPP